MSRIVPSVAKVLALVGLLSSVSVYFPANAAPSKRSGSRAVESTACASLQKEYAMTGKRLAWAKVRGDMGGPAAKLRAEQEATTISSQAQMTLDLLRANKCKVPTASPNRDAYLTQALDCYTAISRATGSSQPPACVMENWKP